MCFVVVVVVADENALVKAAAQFGYTFFERTPNAVKIRVVSQVKCYFAAACVRAQYCLLPKDEHLSSERQAHCLTARRTIC